MFQYMDFSGDFVVKNSPAVQKMQQMWVQSLSQEDLLEKEMATHSNILAWRIPRSEEPGKLQSMQLKSQTWLGHGHSSSNIVATVRISFLFKAE